MNAITATDKAATTPTRYVDVGGRTLAYRSIGEGMPLILCVRFRGVLDVWDPAFLDALARRFRVITFDYSGLGKSTGEASYDPVSLAKDALDLADALSIEKFVAGGWSLGGHAAQALTVLHPERVSHLIVIGTCPPGPIAHTSEPVFLERALKFDNDLDDETVLFFEPASKLSQAASRASHDRIAQRTSDRSPLIPEETYMRLLQGSPKGENEMFHDQGGYRAYLATMEIPMLVISGDHEIVFPVQNWFDVVREWTSMHLLVVPQSGHGPQHQEPQFCADAIISFVSNAQR